MKLVARTLDTEKHTTVYVDRAAELKAFQERLARRGWYEDIGQHPFRVGDTVRITHEKEPWRGDMRREYLCTVTEVGSNWSNYHMTLKGQEVGGGRWLESLTFPDRDNITLISPQYASIRQHRQLKIG
jgi:hypothetical protein